MNAIDTKRATAQRAEIHVGLSDETLAGLATRAEVGAGETDLRDLYPIPQLGAFVRELIAADTQAAPEGAGR